MELPWTTTRKWPMLLTTTGSSSSSPTNLNSVPANSPPPEPIGDCQLSKQSTAERKPKLVRFESSDNEINESRINPHSIPLEKDLLDTLRYQSGQSDEQIARAVIKTLLSVYKNPPRQDFIDNLINYILQGKLWKNLVVICKYKIFLIWSNSNDFYSNKIYL